MEDLITTWGPSIDASSNTMMRMMNLTLVKRVNALDNRTSFSCEVTSRGYEWTGGTSRGCVSQKLQVVNAEKWKKDVLIGKA